MRTALLIARKELLSFLVSPFSYVLAGLFFAVNGAVFFFAAQGPVAEIRGDWEFVTEFFFRFGTFWFLAIFVPPLLTMRLLADEFRLGTIETLMTAPSSDASVVLGKYLAAVGYVVFLWAPTAVFFLIAEAGGASFDWGIVGATYLFVVLVYALFLAIGLFASTLTDTPILSALIAIVLELLLFLVVLLPYLDVLKAALPVEAVAERYSLDGMLGDHFLKGVVDTMHLAFLVSVTGFFLFAATRCLEYRRWR